LAWIELTLQKKQSETIGAVIACLLWSTAFAGVKYGLRYAEPLGFAGIRFMISGLLILPFCGKSIISHYNSRHFYRLVIRVALFQTFLLYAFFYLGMTRLPGALGAIIIGSSPLITAVTAHVMLPHDRMTSRKILCIFVGIFGVILISVSRKPWIPAGWVEFVGIILLLFGTLCSALGNIFVSKDKKQFDPFLLNASQLFLGGLMLTAISLFVEGIPRWPVRFPFVLNLLWLSFLSASAFSIWFMLLKRPGIKVSELNFWKFLIPVFGAIFSWLLLREEKPDWISLAGMCSVSISILFFFYADRTKKMVRK
jgi:drug/metabolite transporter (DMT)-like permease